MGDICVLLVVENIIAKIILKGVETAGVPRNLTAIIREACDHAKHCALHRGKILEEFQAKSGVS